MSTGEQRAPAAGPAEWRWSPCCFGFHAPSVNFSALRSMLAKRLLIKGDYNCDRELRTLELLKVRFGESNLHNAEVMLKVRIRKMRGHIIASGRPPVPAPCCGLCSSQCGSVPGEVASTPGADTGRGYCRI